MECMNEARQRGNASLKEQDQAWKIHFALPKTVSSVDDCVERSRAVEVAWEAEGLYAGLPASGSEENVERP